MILSSVIRGFDSSFVDSFNFIMQNQKAHAEESNSKSIVDEIPTDHIPLAWRNDHEYLSGRTYDI